MSVGQMPLSHIRTDNLQFPQSLAFLLGTAVGIALLEKEGMLFLSPHLLYLEGPCTVSVPSQLLRRA